jgi:dimethylamine/trimethylamine dehydrogenase
MARLPRHDVLFEPVQVGPKLLRNRFYQVPHCCGFGVGKPGSQAAHREVKAEGGWAVVSPEYAPVSLDSDESPFAAANVWDDGDVERLALVADAAHRHGSLASIELTHTGAHASAVGTRWTPIGPSQLASDYEPNHVPREMDLDDIARVRADWVRAAVACVDAGYDIVYAYGAHTYLLTQFLSPFYNRRSDAYGGSLENRARLWLEILADLRAAVGDRAAIAARVGLGLAPGVETDDVLRFVRLADDLVDLWDVNVGAISDWSSDAGPSRFYASGYQLEWTGRVREATAKPIVGVGRLTDPDRMAAIIESGAWDLIGAARPSIADPFLPRKIEEGRYDEIRECIGCNVCIMKGDAQGHIGCTQNATAGEEHRRGWHPERFAPATNRAKDVLVVGAGPAGMECAIVLAKRGFRRVHLVDAAEEPGGHVRWVRRLPGLGEWGRVVDWRVVQLAKQKAVERFQGVRLGPDEVLDYGAELVVVATGSHWAGDGLNAFSHEPIAGADAALAHVLTPEQVMLEGKRPPGRRVVVHDCEGYYVAAGMAELLAGEGYEVEIVTGIASVAEVANATLEGPSIRAQLARVGVTWRVDAMLDEIRPDGVRGEDHYGRRFEREADGVVLVTQRRSDDALHRALVADPDALAAAGIEGVFRIGDCAAPRLIADSVFDGHRLGREIDGPHPAIPLAHRRERAELA